MVQIRRRSAQSCEMSRIWGLIRVKCLRVGVKSLVKPAILQNQAFLEKFTQLMQAFCVKTI